MKKQVIALILLPLLILTGCGKKADQKEISNSQNLQEIINTSRNYQPKDLQGDIVKLKETGDYYFLEPGKHYVFQDPSVYRSWFGDFQPEKEVTVKELEKTALSGIVLFKPSTLMQVELDNHIYLKLTGDQLMVISPELAAKMYGKNYSQQIVKVEPYYFTSYKVVDGDIGELTILPKLQNNIIYR